MRMKAQLFPKYLLTLIISKSMSRWCNMCIPETVQWMRGSEYFVVLIKFIFTQIILKLHQNFNSITEESSYTIFTLFEVKSKYNFKRRYQFPQNLKRGSFSLLQLKLLRTHINIHIGYWSCANKLRKL